MARFLDKDPVAVDDYTWDWADWLGDDSITSHTVAGEGVTIDDSTDTPTSVIARISGGTVGSASATCQITTVDGRVGEETIYFRVRDL